MDPLDGRARTLKTGPAHVGPVLYWMSRDMRLHGNHALAYADKLARERDVPLLVLYDLDPEFLGGTLRQLTFKVEGLRELSETAHEIGIPFSVVVAHDTPPAVLKYAHNHKVATIVTDFSPLRIIQKRLAAVVKEFEGDVYEVDAHNVVPAWILSQKREFAAYTIRPKVTKAMSTWLVRAPYAPRRDEQRAKEAYRYVELPDFDHILAHAKTRRDVEPVSWAHGGEKQAKKMLEAFIAYKLEGYSEKRNDPVANAQSDLSPYLHYGMIWPGEVALAAQASGASKTDIEDFIEELVVRRELADNFCLYEPHYDTPQGYPAWAQETHAKRAKDPREHIYTLKELEEGKTSDTGWNAAQLEMVKHGKMHGYMRMYWCKRLLEWTPDVETAHKYAVYLNDTYELDGRDPNGYAGIAWSLGGVHDRPWFERPIFGAIRYMNYNGLKRKFKVKEYEDRWNTPGDLFGISHR